jgi:hypothetical protein
MKLLFSAAMIPFLFMGCVPQPIYHSIKKDGGAAKTVSIPAGSDTISAVQNAAGDSTNRLGEGKGVMVLGGISKDQQDALMREIKSWMGTPYRFGMVEKGKGTDCSGFVGYVYKKILNLDLPRESRAMFAEGESVAEKELKFGDLVFFQNTYKGAQGASHVGIFVGGNRLAHASTTVGVTISDLSESYYTKHFLGCRRIVKP